MCETVSQAARAQGVSWDLTCFAGSVDRLCRLKDKDPKLSVHSEKVKFDKGDAMV